MNQMRQLENWYTEHPGWHRCSEVAQVTGLSLHDVAVRSYRLAEQGRIQRLRTSVEDYTPSLYGKPLAPVAPGVARKTERRAR